MIQRLVTEELDRLAARVRVLGMLRAVSLVWLAGLVCLTMVSLLASTPQQLGSLPVLGIGALFLAAATLVAVFSLRAGSTNYVRLAKRVETAFPELNTSLRTAVELKPDWPANQFSYLQSRVIHQSLEHARTNHWAEVVSARKLLAETLLNIVLFLLFTGGLAGVALASARTSAGNRPPVSAGDSFTSVVEPGHVEIERGTGLLVLARVQGRMPASGTLVIQNAAGDEVAVPMPASLNDPVFSGRIASVSEPLEYFVRLDDQASPRFRVTVFDYPKLETVDVHLSFPAYTGVEDKLIQDVRTVSAVEGTRLTMTCRFNKPVVSAVWRDAKNEIKGEPIVLVASTADPLIYSATMLCSQSRKLKLELVDETGRKPQQEELFSLRVLPNLPPTVKPVFPARDLEVSPLEELELKAAVSDDFGLQRFGLTYSAGGKPPVDVTLAEKLPAKQKQEVGHLLRLEELSAEPDQLISYYWWAEDSDARGDVRRTQSDMYFAEVRPFEEIFRQGEQPPGGERQRQSQQNQQGGGQNAQQAQELAKLQKEIINATWKVIRREVEHPPTESFEADAEQVIQSQAQAREQAEALGDRLQDERSQTHHADILRHMQTALEQLQAAHDKLAVAPLTPALAAEQAAYQSLLKLRAREHEVVRNQQQAASSQSSQSSSSRSQQQQSQLQQLNLKDEENRYETERAAQEQKQESAQERENRQVLNRLRELAQRQHDLNDRLKELQAALEDAAGTPEEEEARRRLQRLQDEQREMLRDTDELQARLERPENQERMSAERQQLEETRDEVRRAAEALEQERVGQAVAQGTRAERRFDELREELRRRAADRFSQEMQEMRESARELERKEREVGERLRAVQPAEPQPPTLQDEDQRDRREPLAEELGLQRKRLGELQERIRETMEQAEATEPILTERLHAADRKLREQNVDRALQTAQQSVRQGAAQEAERQEAAAGKGLRELREGIERAAEGVLGDETEALRRARRELKELSQELRQEWERNNPEEARADPARGAQPSGQPNSESERQSAEPQDGRGGEPMPGAGRQPMPGEGSSQPGSGRGPARPLTEGAAEEGRPVEGAAGGSPTGGQRPRRSASATEGGASGSSEAGSPNTAAPLTGAEFREWSDRLRDVEEMVGDPELRAEAARVREQARGLRAKFKRHSAPPNGDLVRDRLLKPLNELEQRVAEELLRRTAKKALVPLDRDPVPPKYSEKTRRYYERLGGGK